MSSVIAGYHHRRMQMSHYDCMVGGLPVARKWPFEYKAPFSPIDVIEEYVRPARYLENGHVVTRPALSDPELVHFDGIGTLEAFNTDGLRTLARTIGAPNMKEKTLRYPGHIRLMHELREIGFFSTEKIQIQGVEISPLEFSSKIIFPHWKLSADEDEFTVMRISITGKESDGATRRYTYDLVDRFDRKNRVSSMARTTGYTCSAAVNLVANGYRRPGICPPEFLGESEENFQFIWSYLKERGVNYHKRVETL
jgi:saccharopine dehydrogenase-like NADP-dependent oxidoreductase